MSWKEMLFDELAALYCSRQLNEPPELRTTLLRQKAEYSPTGFMLLQCEQMDSSYFANYVILPYGPNNTFKDVPDRPISPRGLASDMSVVVGVLKAENLTETKMDYAALQQLIASRAELAAARRREAKGIKKKRDRDERLRYADRIQAAVEVAGKILGEHVEDSDKEERIKAVFLKAICG